MRMKRTFLFKIREREREIVENSEINEECGLRVYDIHRAY